MEKYPNLLQVERSKRGFCGIGIYNLKSTKNIGTLWRTAHIMGADFIFIIGKRYETMKTDTMKSWKHLPLFFYSTVEDFFNGAPKGCKIIGVELNTRSIPLATFKHTESAMYLLGAEDMGLSESILDKCNDIVQLPGSYSQNVSSAGAIVLYDRYLKAQGRW